MKLTVELIGGKEFGRKLTRLERQAMPKAASRAINKTAATVRSEAVKMIAKRMGLKQKDVRGGTDIRKARASRLEAEITFRGRPLNLIRFKARQTAKGVTATPYGKRQLYRSAFILRGKTVVRRVRRGEGLVGRLPIRALFGPSIVVVASQDDIMRQMERRARQLLPERLRAQLAFELDRLRAKGRR